MPTDVGHRAGTERTNGRSSDLARKLFGGSARIPRMSRGVVPKLESVYATHFSPKHPVGSFGWSQTGGGHGCLPTALHWVRYP